ncbi:MAG: BatA and WFA domain-containing protein, partial [Pirellulales bacterium]
MSFLSPFTFWLAIGAAAVPVAVHFLTRPRPVRLPLSTIRFVQEAVKQRRTRNRLRDALILALRTLAILLLGWAIARPLMGEKKLVSDAEDGATARVVLLDVSQSMAAAEGGGDAFQRARAAAGQYLIHRPGLRVNLIMAGAAPRPVFEAPSTNIVSLREQLTASEVRPERLNLSAAITMAGEMLAKVSGDDPRRELVVVSDFQRTNWAAADFSSLPEDTLIQLESVAPTEPPENLAVTGVRCEGRPAEGREVRLEVEVGNFAATTRNAKVEVTLGDAAYQLEELCPPRTKTVLSKDIVVRKAGWLAGMARLTGADDALPADNARPFVVDVRPSPTYVLITREPVSKRPSASYYLERALVPSAEGSDRSGARVVRVSPSRLDREMLSHAELLLLDHPGRLKQEQVDVLVSLLRRGRAIIYVAAELVDATNLQMLRAAAGSGLQPPVQLVPPPRGSPRRDLFLTEIKTDRAPFRALGDHSSALIAPLRFAGG